MANSQRGVYEPPDDVHVFDGSEDEEDTEGSRLPLLIVIALFVLASFGGVVWLAYEKGVASGRTEPRTIAAESGPAKVAAEDSSPQGKYKGLKIYEQPAPNESYDGTTVENNSPPPPSQNPSAASPSLRAPVAEAPRTGSPVTKHAAEVNPQAQSPAVKLVPKVSPPTAATAAIPPTTGETVPLSGRYVLQIGSYKSREEADTSWSAFQAKHASLVAGFSPDVKAADLGEKGQWYRLRLGPFSDKEAASAMCDRIKSDGGNCFLSK